MTPLLAYAADKKASTSGKRVPSIDLTAVRISGCRLAVRDAGNGECHRILTKCDRAEWPSFPLTSVAISLLAAGNECLNAKFVADIDSGMVVAT